MGSGTDKARLLSDHIAPNLIDDMKDQLIIALVNRLGGKVEMTAEAIDGTGGYILYLRFKPETNSFVFEAAKK